ncbi:hypothetical protein ZWY2020_015283 [Hordeum vulgare]|nr:hypothetical protein ZWY2020_015283 [Hordeum vulgare]
MRIYRIPPPDPDRRRQPVVAGGSRAAAQPVTDLRVGCRCSSVTDPVALLLWAAVYHGDVRERLHQHDPMFTFLLALPFKIEKLDVATGSGAAKLTGTAVGLAGLF